MAINCNAFSLHTSNVLKLQLSKCDPPSSIKGRSVIAEGCVCLPLVHVRAQKRGGLKVSRVCVLKSSHYLFHTHTSSWKEQQHQRFYSLLNANVSQFLLRRATLRKSIRTSTEPKPEAATTRSVFVTTAGDCCSCFFEQIMYQIVRKMFFTDCHCAADASKTYEELFAKLDTNKDGKVDISELKAGLSAMGIRSGKGAAQVTG